MDPCLPSVFIVGQVRRHASRAACGASIARRIRRRSGAAVPTARAPCATPAGCESIPSSIASCL